MNDIGRDLMHAQRSMRRNPWFAGVVVATLAVGIGGATAMFSVVNAVLISRLPYVEPDRIVHIWEDPEADGTGRQVVAFGTFGDLRDREGHEFASIAAYANGSGNLTGNGTPEHVTGLLVTSRYMDVLRLPVAVGRGFNANEDQSGNTDFAVLSHSLWARRFGSDSNLAGLNVLFEGTKLRVVGVLSESVRISGAPDFLSPLSIARDGNRADHQLSVIARLADGITLSQAQSAISAFRSGIESRYPTWKADWGLRVMPMQKDMIASIEPRILMLFGAVTCVLLIACANVANLLLVRSVSRAREVALRATLGASRGRIVRQLLTESLTLSACAGVLGTLLAAWLVVPVSRMAESVLPRASEVAIDTRVLAFAIVATFATGILFGLVPALSAARSDLRSGLVHTARAGGGGGAPRIRSVFVVAEVALALILVAGAGLLTKSLVHILDVHPGFDSRSALAMDLAIPHAKYPTLELRARYLQRLLDEVGSVPGVISVGFASTLPMNGWSMSNTVTDAKGPEARPARNDPRFDFVAGDYFAAAGIPLRAGRTFLPDEEALIGEPAAILSQSLATRIFATRNAIGERVPFQGRVWSIVGIVGDVRHDGLDDARAARIYVPQFFTGGDGTLLVKTIVPPLTLAEAVQSATARIDADQATSNTRTFDQAVHASVADRRLVLGLLGGFGAIAFLLAGLGIYSVMHFAVAQRTREFGVRIALGAQVRDVIALVTRQGAGLIGLGLAIGTAAALALTRLLANQLYEVRPTDPGVFLMVICAFVTAGFVAMYVPARRASRVDPIIALRSE